MERAYQNPRELANSYGDPESYMLPNEPLNHFGPINYGVANYDQSPFSYAPMPVCLHPGGDLTSTCQNYGHGSHGAMGATGFLRPRSQFHRVRNPTFDLLRYEDDMDMPVSNNLNIRGGPAAKDNPNMFCGGSPWGGDDRYAGYQSNVPSIRIHEQNKGYPFNGGFVVHTPYYGTNLNQSNVFPEAQDFSLPNFPMPDDRVLTKDALGDIRYNRGYQGFTAAPMPFGSGQVVLPIKNNFVLSEMDLPSTSGRENPEERISFRQQQQHGYMHRVRTNGSGQDVLPNKNIMVSCEMDLPSTSGRENPGERNFSQQQQQQQQHGYKHRFRTNPTTNLAAASTSRDIGSTSNSKKSGQRGKTHSNKSTWRNRYATPPFRNGSHTSAAPRQVWRKKISAQPSASQSKKSRKHRSRIYHITWDGFDEDELCEPVGETCEICQEDLSHAPMDDDDEWEHYDEIEIDGPSKLPVVSVLPCGHAFHSECLQVYTPEEQSADPPPPHAIYVTGVENVIHIFFQNFLMFLFVFYS